MTVVFKDTRKDWEFKQTSYQMWTHIENTIVYHIAIPPNIGDLELVVVEEKSNEDGDSWLKRVTTELGIDHIKINGGRIYFD